MTGSLLLAPFGKITQIPWQWPIMSFAEKSVLLGSGRKKKMLGVGGILKLQLAGFLSHLYTLTGGASSRQG